MHITNCLKGLDFLGQGLEAFIRTGLALSHQLASSSYWDRNKRGSGGLTGMLDCSGERLSGLKLYHFQRCVR